ncbi:MAG: hypothetical protein IJX82_04040 [Clostridia bacterium]|nr:hypothetical protein [Clostridia bacterium]
MMEKTRQPLFHRIKYALTGYKMRNFLTALRKKAPKYLLITLLVLSFCYLSLNPIHKLKVLFFFTRSCTIEVTVRGPNDISPQTESITFVDGNWVQKGDSYYYKIEDEKIYNYRRSFMDQWDCEISDYTPSAISTELFDRSNWTRAEGHLFVWELDDEVEKQFNNFHDVRLRRENGRISIVGYRFYGGSRYEVVISFSRFGMTGVNPPFEE